MGNSLTLIKNIFSYDLIYIHSLLSKIDYSIRYKGGAFYFDYLSNYVELYDYLSRIEVIDEVIDKYELTALYELYPLGYKHQAYEFYKNSIDFIKTAIYVSYFPTWMHTIPLNNIQTIYSNTPVCNSYISLLEEYITIRYKDKYRGEILDGLID